MQCAIGIPDLGKLVKRQIDSLFFLTDAEGTAIDGALDGALSRTEFCFSQTENKYYSLDGKVYFNPLHSGQYTIFLYFLSRSIFLNDENPNRILCDKVYYLNRSLNGVDLFYEVNLPKVFFLDHPLGSVMGRARYGEGFRFSQHCTVGNNNGKYPTIGRNVTMMSGSKIVGDSTIGDDVILSANSYVKDTDIPAASIVFGQHPHIIIKPRDPGRSS